MSEIHTPYAHFGDSVTLKQSLCLDSKSKGFKRGRPSKEMDKKVCEALKAQYDKYVKETKKAMKESKKKEKKATAPKEKKAIAPKKCAEILSSKFKTEEKFKVACKSTIQNKKPCRNYRNPSDKKMYCYSKSNKSKVTKTNYKALNAV